MPTSRIDTDALAARFCECTPRLDGDGRRISVALYRLLAEGEPVASDTLATKVGLADDAVQDVLQSWPGVFFDERKRVQGYWGLAIPEMSHRFEVEGRTLYTWCAWDSLFLPEILQKSARVSSSCPVTGETIRLTVHPGGIETIEPAETVMSFPGIDRIELGENVITSFCHFVHFFRSHEAAGRWLENHRGQLILSSEEAFELARKKNALQYGLLE